MRARPSGEETIPRRQQRITALPQKRGYRAAIQSLRFILPEQKSAAERESGSGNSRHSGDHGDHATSLVDLLDPAGVAWQVYAENLPSPCFTGITSPDGLYVRHHEPYISFRTIQAKRARCERIVSADQLSADLARNALPRYSLYVPNIRNDGHDTGVAYAATWLQAFLSPLLQSPPFTRDTLDIVTFDENAGARGNQIYTTFVGPMVRPGATNGIRYDHYSLLRTLEDNYGVGTLGREDAKATAICCVWKE